MNGSWHAFVDDTRGQFWQVNRTAPERGRVFVWHFYVGNRFEARRPWQDCARRQLFLRLHATSLREKAKSDKYKTLAEAADAEVKIVAVEVMGGYARMGCR